MSNPNDKHTDELISAYLDGEVTSQERAQVEQRLRTDPQWQQTLEELRTLRETLQALPRQKLDARFRQRVLQKVHEQPAPEAALTASPPVAPAPPKGPASSTRKVLRGLMWATSAAAAVALLIVYTAPLQRDAARSVASNPSSPREADQIAERSEVPSAGTNLLRDLVRSEDDHARPEVAFHDPDAPLDSTRNRGKAGRRLGDGLQVAPTVERQSGLAASDSEQVSLREEAVSSERDTSAAELEMTRRGVEAAPQSAPEPRSCAAKARFDDRAGGGWAADAVVHIQLAATDESSEQDWVENLARNSIVVVREEQAQTAQGVAGKPLPEQPANVGYNSLYFQNQVAVDYPFGEAQTAEGPVQLWLVEATAPQITNAVHELQQEGAAVLATVPGPRRLWEWSAARAPRERVARPTPNLEPSSRQQRTVPAAAAPQEAAAAPQIRGAHRWRSSPRILSIPSRRANLCQTMRPNSQKGPIESVNPRSRPPRRLACSAASWLPPAICNWGKSWKDSGGKRATDRCRFCSYCAAVLPCRRHPVGSPRPKRHHRPCPPNRWIHPNANLATNRFR